MTRRTKRDEFSCPCCGTPTDSNYCAPCDAAECGEQDVGSLDVCLVDIPTPPSLPQDHDEHCNWLGGWCTCGASRRKAP